MKNEKKTNAYTAPHLSSAPCACTTKYMQCLCYLVEFPLELVELRLHLILQQLHTTQHSHKPPPHHTIHAFAPLCTQPKLYHVC